MAFMGKTRMNIYLNDAQRKSLERLSAQTGAPVAELVRRAVDNYLALRKKELK
jgi:predicted DNA-binding protein